MKQLEMYPFGAGYKEIAGVSKQIAKKQNKELNNRFTWSMALNLFKVHLEGLTSDEVAEMLNESISSIRPRVSELRAQGKIVSTGKRRKSSTGNGATVWRLNDAHQKLNIKLMCMKFLKKNTNILCH